MYVEIDFEDAKKPEAVKEAIVKILDKNHPRYNLSGKVFQCWNCNIDELPLPAITLAAYHSNGGEFSLEYRQIEVTESREGIETLQDAYEKDIEKLLRRISQGCG